MSEEIEKLTEQASPKPSEPAPIRPGSPFRGDPFPDPILDGVEGGDLAATMAAGSAGRATPDAWDVGVTKSTATGATLASAIILVFAAASAWSFPSGGIVVPALGCLLATFGMISPMLKTAILCLVLHLGLFAICFVNLTNS